MEMDVLRWMAESYTSGVVRDFFVLKSGRKRILSDHLLGASTS